MGTDKAALVIDDEPLWHRQIAKLRATGADELLISGPANGPYAGAECRVVEDRIADAGPLAALDAMLRGAVHDWVLVLAVDLIDVPVAFLSTMSAAAIDGGVGLVPVRDTWFQPLAAIYPRRCLAVVEAHLDGPDHSLRSFFREAVARGLVKSYPVGEEEVLCFRNLNTPADLKARSV